MAYQNITGSLSPEDIQEIKAAFATIQGKMPFLVTLSVEERRKLFKMGDKSLVVCPIIFDGTLRGSS
ncbi:hypothetical protein [Nostoc sp.]|uniref:hypothetical protein n=1 Tax=Nostoc sp. TaxID=1180 RepID=UPI002FF8DFE4